MSNNNSNYCLTCMCVRPSLHIDGFLNMLLPLWLLGCRWPCPRFPVPGPKATLLCIACVVCKYLFCIEAFEHHLVFVLGAGFDTYQNTVRVVVACSVKPQFRYESMCVLKGLCLVLSCWPLDKQLLHQLLVYHWVRSSTFRVLTTYSCSFWRLLCCCGLCFWHLLLAQSVCHLSFLLAIAYCNRLPGHVVVLLCSGIWRLFIMCTVADLTL